MRCISGSILELSGFAKGNFEGKPAHEHGEDGEGGPASEQRGHGLSSVFGPRRTDGEECHAADDVEEAEDEAEGSTEAADDFAGVFFAEIWIENAEAGGEAVQCKGHHCDGDGEEKGVVHGEFEHATGEPNQAESQSEGGKAGEGEFGFNDADKTKRRHANDPDTFAFERELWIDKTGRERGEVEATRAKVEEGDKVDPEWIGELLGEVAEVDDVNAEQAEQNECLAPLSRVAPKDADVFDEKGEVLGAKFWKEEAEKTFEAPCPVDRATAEALPAAEPIPMAEDCAAALDGGGGGVEGFAKFCEGEEAEKEGVAEEDEREKYCAGESAFGPIQDAGGKPVARERGKHGETRLHEHAIEDGENAGFEHFVGDGFRAEPFRANEKRNDADEDECDLK